MTAGADRAQATDPGLSTLVMLLQHLRLYADAEQARRLCGTPMTGIADVLRCAKELGLEARTYKTQWEALGRASLPGIVTLRDGRFLLVEKTDENKVLVASAGSTTLAEMSRGEFEMVWDGNLVVITRRKSLLTFARNLLRAVA